MNPTKLWGAGALALLLSACVTINIYFPEAQADQAVKAIVKDVLGKDVPAAEPAPTGEKGSALEQPFWAGWCRRPRRPSRTSLWIPRRSAGCRPP